MALWRKKQPDQRNQSDRPNTLQAGDPIGYNAVVSLIRTRVDFTASMHEVQRTGLHEQLAARYLDLAMVLAARELLLKTRRVKLPENYLPTVKVPELSALFKKCHITKELIDVYQAEPTAAALLGPLAPDFAVANNALQRGAEVVSLPPAQVGDGSHVRFARETLGDAAVLKVAEAWPALS